MTTSGNIEQLPLAHAVAHGLDARAWLGRRKVRRSISAAAVIVVHLAAMMLLVRQHKHEQRAAGTGHTVLTASILEASNVAFFVAPAEVPVADLAATEFAPVQSVPPSAQFEEIPVDVAAPQSARFIPPRLERASEGRLVEFERQASLRKGEIARVILSVEVQADGTVGAIDVETTSGMPRADVAAVEYARSLRWTPASLAGRSTKMLVRLPVIFTGTG